ncbi:hypothetical protein Tco_0427753 [Tanacetum coccineum]
MSALELPTCIPWTSDVAQTLRIPRLVFHGPGCFWMMCMHVVFTTNVLAGIESDSQPFVLPELPDRIEVTKLQVMGSSRIDLTGLPGSVHEYKKPRNLHTGPVSLCNKDDLDISERGNKAAVNEHDCLEWLDGNDPGSVMYICLGTLTRVPT